MFKLVIGRLVEIDRTPRYLYVRLGRWDWCSGE